MSAKKEFGFGSAAAGLHSLAVNRQQVQQPRAEPQVHSRKTMSIGGGASLLVFLWTLALIPLKLTHVI